MRKLFKKTDCPESETARRTSSRASPKRRRPRSLQRLLSICARNRTGGALGVSGLGRWARMECTGQRERGQETRKVAGNILIGLQALQRGAASVVTCLYRSTSFGRSSRCGAAVVTTHCGPVQVSATLASATDRVRAEDMATTVARSSPHLYSVMTRLPARRAHRQHLRREPP